MTTIRQHIQLYLEQLQEWKLSTVGSIHGRKDVEMNFSRAVLSEKKITIDNFLTNRFDVSDSSLVVIFGTIPGTPRPNVSWSPGWLPTADVNVVGTVWNSNANFLQRLLSISETFNAQTTIVRKGVNDFVTLHERENSEKTQWRREETFDSLEWLAYTWDYKFDASKREGTVIRQDLDSFLRKSRVTTL